MLFESTNYTLIMGLWTVENPSALWEEVPIIVNLLKAKGFKSREALLFNKDLSPTFLPIK